MKDSLSAKRATSARDCDITLLAKKNNALAPFWWCPRDFGGGDVGEHRRAQVVRDRQRAQGIERDERDLVAGEELFLIVDPPADPELDRAPAELRDRELEHQPVAEMAGAEELAAGVDDRKTQPPHDVHVVEAQPDRVAEPVLDAAADHVEEVDEVDDTGRVAVREADPALGGEDLGHRSGLGRERARRRWYRIGVPPPRDRAAADNAAPMKTVYRILAALPAALALSAAAADFEPGQIWTAVGREKDPDPQILVLQVEKNTPVGEVVFVAAGGVKLCLPNGDCGDTFSPLAMSKAALERSVKTLVGTLPDPAEAQKRPQYDLAKGYQFWKDGIAKGALVTITVPLADALDQIEGGAKIQVK